jgi:hypothetical protein
MPTSYNGWPASPDPASIDVDPFSVAGVDFPGGVRRGDVATMLGHVVLEFHQRVEPLRTGQCFGHAYRADRNDPSKLSCHGSGTAVDTNSVKHPNGAEAARTFTAAQIAEIHTILAEIPELAEVVHWGGDWHYADGLTPDGMHWEIHNHDLAKLARVADHIRALQNPREAMLKELRAIAHRHNVTLVALARTALYGAAQAAVGRRLARINTARLALKGMK